MDKAINIADLDAHEEELSLGDELGPSAKIKAKVLRPILDGDFEVVKLDSNLMRPVRI